MTEHPTGERRVLRPDPSVFRERLGGRWRAAGGAVAVVVVCLIVAADGLLYLGAVLATFVALVGVLWGTMRTSSVTLGGRRVAHRRWFVRETTLAADAELQGVLGVYLAFGAEELPADLLMLRHRDGGPRIRLSGVFWNAADLEKIAAYAGVERTGGLLLAEDFHARVPGIMPMRDRRPISFVMAVVLVPFTLLVAGLLLYVSFFG